MIKRWVDLWLNWLDQFRYLFAPDPDRTVCGACGRPWTGESCGQKDNGWPFPTCNPVSTKGQNQ
jgi:hypothetical protein